MTISSIRVCQRYKVLLPHFQLDWTAKDLKFCSRTSVLSWLPKIWSYASTLPWIPIKRSSASASPLCLECPSCDTSNVPHFCSANSSEDVKCRVPLLHFRPALTCKYMKFSFCTSALPGLLKVLSFVSTLPFCLDWQKCEIRLSKLLFCQDFERSQVPRPHFFDQDFQRFEGPFPHFISARTSKDVKFRFCTSALPWLSKIWSSASPLTLCFNCQKCEIPLPHFRSAMTAKYLKFRFHYFVLPSKLRFRPSACLDCKRCAVLLPQFRCMLCHEGLAL